MLQLQYQLRLSQDNSWHMDRPHFHEEIEILLPLSEGDNLFVENELYPLRKGELFVLDAGTLHKTISSNPYQRYVLHVPPAMLSELSTPQSDFEGALKKCGRCTLLSEADTTELLDLFQELEQPREKQFGSDIRQMILLLQFFLKVFSLVGVSQPEKADLNPNFARVTPILKYIQTHIHEPLTLDMVAARFFINKYHLCHIFKNATGFSVLEYIIHCRVLRARQLLREGMRVQEVGESVGFRSNEHFIRTFGALTGISPKQYAKEYLSGVKC